MRKIFILIPADHPHGPVKGAYAPANALSTKREVTLVTVKQGPGAETPLSPNVTKLCLADTETNSLGKVSFYKGLLARAGGRKAVSSISMCFSADAINALCSRHAITCSSVRGNLLANYRLDYGIKGTFLAITHLASLRAFDTIVAMTKAMAKQIKQYSNRDSKIIGNFIDETSLRQFQCTESPTGSYRFTFVGSLSERKQPWLLIEAAASIVESGYANIELHFIGDGPLRNRLKEESQRFKVEEKIHIHGFLKNPYKILSNTDAMVLPSLSEGLPRAALEAMYLGAPCILRQVDGNSELVRDGINGKLFNHDHELPKAMIEAMDLRRNRQVNSSISLLPQEYSQEKGAKAFLELIESIR